MKTRTARKASHAALAAATLAPALMAGCQAPAGTGLFAGNLPQTPVHLSADLPVAPGQPLYRTQTLFTDSRLAVAVAKVRFAIAGGAGSTPKVVDAVVNGSKAEINLTLPVGEYQISAVGIGGGGAQIDAKGEIPGSTRLDGKPVAIAIDMFQRLELGKTYSGISLAENTFDRFYIEAPANKKYRLKVWGDAKEDMVAYGPFESGITGNIFEGLFDYHDDDAASDGAGESIDFIGANGSPHWFKVATRAQKSVYNVLVEECSCGTDTQVTVEAR